MFTRLGSFCFRRRWIVVGVWLAALLIGGAIANGIGADYSDDFSLPDVESKTGFDILETQFEGSGTTTTGTIVFMADQGVHDPAVASAMTAYFDRVRAIDGVVDVESPYDTTNPRAASQIASRGKYADKVAFAAVATDPDIGFTELTEIGKEMRAERPELEGLQVELGGANLAEFEEPSSESLGIAFAIFILIFAFGSVLAMGLPIGVALGGIFGGSVIVMLISRVTVIPELTNVIAIMIGLGVGIDYALFIVTRYRENLHRGHSYEESTVIALDTAGRAVLFAGLTVVISMLGMLIMQVSFVSGLAIGMATVVGVTVIASLTLLPALLGFAKGRVEVTRWRGLIAAALVALALIGAGLKIDALMVGVPLAVVVVIASLAVRPLRQEVPARRHREMRDTIAYKWSRVIQHRPWTAAISGALILVLLMLPVLSLRLGFSDEGNYPENTTTRKAYDLLAAGFGPGFNGELILVAELPEGWTPADLDTITEALQGADGVAFASPPNLNDPQNPAASTAALWQVVPETAPQDEATTAFVRQLRNDVLPDAEASSGIDVHVAGAVAINVDFSDYLAERLPYFFAAVLILSFILLMLVFRSVLVPLKAVVMNLLSIGAAYGVVVAVFQWGWFGGILGIAPAPIEPFVPMMMFAIVFGLSMDYEVFLLSRVKEEWTRTGDSHTSVADGLAATARVISAAAAIMVFVFGSFLLENDRVVKVFGLGLAIAVLLDATVVRMLLVPATMELLGDKNWWLPKWLDRILPTINVEGDEGEAMEELRAEYVLEEVGAPTGGRDGPGESSTDNH